MAPRPSIALSASALHARWPFCATRLARALADQGLQIERDPDSDFTETHQVLLRTARGQGEHVADRLEANNIITNPQAYLDDPSFAVASGVRMGSQEMTRFGMKERDFEEFAALLAETIGDGTGKDRRDEVKAFRQRFVEMQYCFKETVDLNARTV